MYRSVDKRKQTIRLVLIYTVVPILVAVFVTLMVLYMIGYRFNSSDASLSQGGLLQLASRPSGARVSIDGATLSGRTNTRHNITAGTHTVLFERDGYVPWQKSVSIKPGQVLWLNYAWMIPEKLSRQTLHTYPAVYQALAHPDSRQLLVLADRSKPTLDVIRADNGRAPRRSVEIPATVYDPAAGATLELVEWSGDGRRALVRVVKADVDDEWLLVDVKRPNETRNISRIVERPITSAVVDTTDSSRVYVLSDAAIRRIDSGAQTMSVPLARNVVSIAQSHDGVVTYTTSRAKDTSQRTVGYITPGAKTGKTLRVFIDDGSIRLSARIGKYSDQEYVAVLYGRSLEIGALDLVSSDDSAELRAYNLATLAVPAETSSIDFSPTSRFVLTRAGNTYATYDIELAKFTNTTLKGTASKTAQLGWLDDTHLWSGRDDEVVVYEFDGENPREIMPIAPRTQPVLSDNGKYLYSIARADDGKLRVLRTQLVP